MAIEKLSLGNIYHQINAVNHRFKRRIRALSKGNQPPGVTFEKDKSIPTIEAIKAFSERYSLSGLLPYESYDQKTGLFYNTDSLGFMLYAFPAASIGQQQLSILNEMFSQQQELDAKVQVTLICSPETAHTVEAWYDARKFSTDPDNAMIFQTLAKSRCDYLLSGKWKSLFDNQDFSPRDYHLIFSYTVPTPEGMSPYDLDDEAQQSLLNTRSNVIGALRSAGIYSHNIKPRWLINLLNGLLNPCQDNAPSIDYNEFDSLSQQILDADTAFLAGSHTSSIVHKDACYSVMPFHVRQWPKQWAGFRNGELIGSFVNNINRLSCPFIATLAIDFGDPLDFKSKAKANSLRSTQMATSPVSKYVPEWQERKRDWDFVVDELDNGSKLVNMFYQVVLFTPQGTEQVAEQNLRGVYSALGWQLSKSSYMPIHALLAALPMGISKDIHRSLQMFGHYRTQLTWTATNCAPWIGEWKGTQTPKMLFNGRRGQIVSFDPFDNDKGNFNIAIAAKSGSGKSFVAQEMISNTLSAGGRAVVIDSGHSYRNQCALLKGVYIEFNDDDTLVLNPFSHINEADPNHFVEQLPLLKMMLAQMASSNDNITQLHQALLEKAIFQSWQAHKSQSTITTVVEALDNFKTDDMSNNTATELSLMLHSYTKDGMYGRYFEGKSDISFDKNFIVLELSGLNKTPDLQSVVLLYLVMRITQMMYHDDHRSQNKLCIIDEAWRLLREGMTGDFIEEGFRVVRKYGGAFITITQAITDYFQSPSAEAAFNNSDFKCYLQQGPEVLSLALERGYIDNASGRVDILKTLETIQHQYSEIAIESPDGLSVCRFVVDPFSEKLYSTQADEVSFIQQSVKKGMALSDAIQVLVDQSRRN